MAGFALGQAVINEVFLPQAERAKEEIDAGGEPRFSDRDGIVDMLDYLKSIASGEFTPLESGDVDEAIRPKFQAQMRDAAAMILEAMTRVKPAEH
jgi:hypothetical protein